MPTDELTPDQQDRLRTKISQGLIAEEALPFVRPFLEQRLDELHKSSDMWVFKCDKDRAWEVAIRISEVNTMFTQLGIDIHLGRKSDLKLGEAR